MTIHRRFLSELCLHDMYNTEKYTSRSDEAENTFSETSSSSYSDFSESSLDSLDIKEMALKGILKVPSSLPRTERVVDDWIGQPIPDFHPSRSRRRRRRKGSTTKSNQTKYDRVKTRFYPLEDQRERPEGSRKQCLPKKILEEQGCLKTCRSFL